MESAERMDREWRELERKINIMWKIMNVCPTCENDQIVMVPDLVSGQRQYFVCRNCANLKNEKIMKERLENEKIMRERLNNEKITPSDDNHTLLHGLF